MYSTILNALCTLNTYMYNCKKAIVLFLHIFERLE